MPQRDSDPRDSDPLDQAKPEADRLEQERADLDDGFDPEAPVSAPIPVSTTQADEADVVEQSFEVSLEDDDRER